MSNPYNEEVAATHKYMHNDPPPREEAVNWIKFVVENIRLVNGFWPKMKAMRQFIRILVTRG